MAVWSFVILAGSVAFMPPRPNPSRQPLPSITREVSVPEMTELVQGSRPPEEADTASLGGAEMDALLAGERASARPAAAPASPARPAFTERPRISVPPAEPTVVLAPQLTAPAAPPAVEPPPAPAPAAVAAVMQHARTEAASPFEATRVGTSYMTKQPRVAAEPPKTLLAVGIGAIVLVVVGAVIFFAARGGAEPSASGAQTTATPVASGLPVVGTTATPVGSGSPVVGTTATPVASGPPAVSGPEAEARAALARLRDGIGTCVRDVIGVLPGTSPAIPSLMATLKKTAYQSVPRDYRSPVFSCTKFRESDLQRYQIQWQLVTRPSEGRGVAWLDDDDDGRADRAFAFRAALIGKNQVELGEIGPITPVPPVMKALE